MKPSSQHFFTWVVFVFMAVAAARERSILIGISVPLMFAFTQMRERPWVSQSLAATLAVMALGLIGAACGLAGVARMASLAFGAA